MWVKGGTWCVSIAASFSRVILVVRHSLVQLEPMTPSPAADGAVSPAVMLSVDGVAKRFGGVTATADVSVDVPNGSILSIIGPNGAGKTSLLNMISGFYKPDKGRITLDGLDIEPEQRSDGPVEDNAARVRCGRRILRRVKGRRQA